MGVGSILPGSCSSFDPYSPPLRSNPSAIVGWWVNAVFFAVVGTMPTLLPPKHYRRRDSGDKIRHVSSGKVGYVQ